MCKSTADIRAFSGEKRSEKIQVFCDGNIVIFITQTYKNVMRKNGVKSPYLRHFQANDKIDKQMCR